MNVRKLSTFTVWETYAGQMLLLGTSIYVSKGERTGRILVLSLDTLEQVCSIDTSAAVLGISIISDEYAYRL